MEDENETKIRTDAGQGGTESPAKTPAGVPRLSRKSRPPVVHYKDQPPDTVCVYLMTTEQWVKIGVSKDPDFRRRQLQSSCPYEVDIVEARAFRTEEEARRVERDLHRLLADFRGYGEWFGFKIESVQNALSSMSATSVWRCTQYPRSRRWPSPADKLERFADEPI